MVDEYLYIILVFFVVILGWLLFLTFKYKKLLSKAEIIFKEEKPEKLTSLINKYFDKIEKVEDTETDIRNELSRIRKMSETGLHKVGLIRYNPFGSVGGNQSFSLALLNKENNGFVISSIHSREGTRVYSKPITGGDSAHNLSEEEKKSIEIAINKKTK